MDDLFFSNDNRSSKNGSGGKRPTNEPRYEKEPSEEDFYDVFSDKSQDKKFKVTLPSDESVFSDENASFEDYSEWNNGEEPSVYSTGRNDGYGYGSHNIDRTPKGRRKGSEAPKVTPPVSSSSYTPQSTSYRGTSHSPSRTPIGTPSRTPTGKPVGTPSRTPTGTPKSDPKRTPQGTRRGTVQSVTPKKTPSVYTSSQKKSKPKYKTSPSGGKKSGGNAPLSGKAKIFLAIAGIFTVLFLALFAYGYNILGKISYDDQISKENQYINNSMLASDSKVKNILFIGSDARNDVQGMRSDTMMLFSIDTANKKIKLTSFLRDSYVCIPSSGKYKKLNAACSAGGAQLVIDTIEYNFKTEIDNYVLVDFEVFTKFIDLLGGLDVPDVTAAEAKYLKEVVKVPKVKEGKNHFTGGATLWYCRIRYLDDDFHRTQRQRKVIAAIIDTVAHTNPVKLVDIVSQIMPMIKTDISRNELLGLALGAITRYMHYDILQHQVPAKGTWSNANIYGVGAVLKMDIDKNAKLLEEFIYSEYVEPKTTKKSK